MPPPRPPGPSTEWMPSGFPPRSFPPGRAVAAPAVPSRRPPKRGRWLAAAAALVAVLLLAVGLLLATRDDGDSSDLATGTSTSAVDTSVAAIDESTTTAAVTPASADPVSTTVAGVTTAVPPPVNTGAAAGVLEPSLSTLPLPKADVTVGATRAAMVLRNTGAGPLTYTTSSSAPGLSAAPARGTIGPGGSANITVTLDGARVPSEGPFSGTLNFGGTGGAKVVQVQSVVGRPPEFTDNVGEVCAVPTTTCSQQIKVAPTGDANASPCNTAWLYSITISDQSRIQSARAIARMGLANADAPLQRGGNSDIFQSNAFPPLPSGTVLRFALEAVDEHGFGRRLSEQTIAC